MSQIIHRIPDTGFVYLATPYRAHTGGNHQAWLDSVTLKSRFVNEAKLRVFSPIASFHPIAEQTGIDGHDPLWQTLDNEFLARASAFIIGCFPGWHNSSGIMAELVRARTGGLPIFYCAAEATRQYMVALNAFLSDTPPKA